MLSNIDQDFGKEVTKTLTIHLVSILPYDMSMMINLVKLTIF